MKNFAGATLVAATLGFAALPALGQSAWLPAEGKFVATPSYVYQNFSKFWINGGPKNDLGYDVVQNTVTVGLEYGLSESLALDASVGYSRVDSKAFTENHSNSVNDGLSDTRVGVRWRLVDERTSKCPYAPTLTLRAGGIVAGSYEAGPPFAAGDGANGGEFSLLAGKGFGDTGFGLHGEAGYRVRSRPVPDDFFATVGAYQTIGSFTLHVAYRHTQGLSGTNIGAPNFTFPELKETNQILEVGLGFRDSGNRFYQVFGAKNIGGRNTGDKTIIGVSASFPF